MAECLSRVRTISVDRRNRKWDWGKRKVKQRVKQRTSDSLSLLWKLLWNSNILSELSWVGPRWLVLHTDLSVIHWMWIQGREITLHKVTCAAEVKTAERASGWRLSASSTPNNWGHKSSTEGRSGGHIIVSTRSTLCANWFYLLINNLWATSMDSSRLVFLNEFYITQFYHHDINN